MVSLGEDNDKWEVWKIWIIKTLEEYDKRINDNTNNHHACSMKTRVDIAKLDIKAAFIGGIIGSAMSAIISIIGAIIVFRIKSGGS